MDHPRLARQPRHPRCTALAGGRRPLYAAGLAAAIGCLAAPGVAFAAGPVVFESPTNHAVLGLNPSGVAIADLNGDGRADLATADTTSDQVTVLAQTADGGFTAAVAGAVGDDPSAVVADDFTGDGVPDIATIDGVSRQVSLLANDGAGLFSPSVLGSITGRPINMAVGDLNRDGRPDIVSSDWISDTATLFLSGSTPGTYAVTSIGPTSTRPMGLALGDVDGDGRLDVITAGNEGQTVEALMQQGDGSFTRTVLADDVGTPNDVQAADMNGDGLLDLVVNDTAGNRILLLVRDAAGTGYTQRVLATTGSAARRTAIGDVDHDGRPDVVSTEQSSAVVTVFVKDREGDGYTATSLGTAGTAPVGLDLGDVDGDGRTDVVTANAMTNDVSVFLNRTEIDVPPPTVDPPTADDGSTLLLPRVPAAPVALAAPVVDPLPAVCIPGGLELVGVTPAGRRTMPRVRLTGVADPSLVGSAVRVLRNGQTVGTTTVRAGGAVATTMRAPQRVRDAARARYQLVVGDRRSRAVRARRIAQVTARAKTATGQIRIRGTVGRVKRRRALTVRATPFCGRAAPRTRRIRSDRSGMFRVTLAAPAPGSPPLVYRVFDGKRTVTLPIVVTARK